MKGNVEDAELIRRAKDFVEMCKKKGIQPVCLESEYREKTYMEQRHLFVNLLTYDSPGWYNFPRKKKWKDSKDAVYVDNKTGREKKKNPWNNAVWFQLSGNNANWESGEHQLDQMIWGDTNDSYITANAMDGEKNDKGYRVRSNRNCIAINGIHFDIDILHNRAVYNAKLADDVIRYVIAILYKVLPEPTMIVLSGRGIAWYLKYNKPIQIGKSNDSVLHDQMYKCALDRLRKLFEDWKGVIDIDTVSDHARVTRIAGTINRKAGRYAELYKWNPEVLYDPEELSDAFGLDPCQTNPERTNKAPAKARQSLSVKNNTTHNYKKQLDDNILPYAELGIRRYAKSRLPMLREIPLYKVMTDGTGRHKLIFAAYSLARYVMVHDQAVEYASKINNTFAEPLEKDDFEMQIARVDAHCEKNTDKRWADIDRKHGDGTYLFSDHTLVNKFLPITMEEAIEHGWLRTYMRNQEYAKNQKESEKRDRRIAELWLNEKMSSIKIAQSLQSEGYAHVAEKTVRNRLKAMGLTAERTQEISDLHFDLRYHQHNKEEYGKLSYKVEEGKEEKNVVLESFQMNEKVIDALKGEKNLWITGGAGAGKTTHIQWYKKHLSTIGKSYAVVAAYAVSAQHAGGGTINSILNIRSDKVWAATDEVDYFELSALLKIDVLIIDEIGTVRPDVFCRIWKLIREAERRCNHHVRLIVVGDFLQLLPFYSRDDQEKMKERKLTISNTVWCTAEWNAAIQQTVYLHGSKRATDKGYAKVLNLLANGENLDYCVDYLNNKLRISQMSIYNLEKLGAVYLSSYRKHVDAVNDYYIEMHRNTDETFREIECKHYYKTIKNQKIPKDQEDAEYPVARKMPIYIGMRVMFVKNSTHYANGTCGTIINIDDTRLTVKTDRGEEIIVKQQMIRADNSPTACIKQYPLVPAYAITIHKAQGLTLDRVVVDPETFAAGQLYVALSRTRQIDDIIITRKIKRSDIIYDYEAAQYMRNIQEQYQVS